MLPAIGNTDSMQAALSDVDNVTDALVVENDTAAPSLGIAAHGIWAIVEGGLDADIADAIYSKKMPGCAQTGSESVIVTRPEGNTFTVLFDRPTYTDLYIEFTITPKTTGTLFDEDSIKTQLVADLKYYLNRPATISDIVVAMLEIDSEAILSDVGVSDDNITYVDILDPSTYQHKFVLTTARIDITVVP